MAKIAPCQPNNSGELTVLEQTHKHKYVRPDKRTDVNTDGRKDRQKDERKDGQKDGLHDQL